jgi:hypothetical protein
VFRRCLGREAEAVDVLGSAVVSEKETHHIDAGPHHRDHKQEILNHHNNLKWHCGVILNLVTLTIWLRKSRTHNSEIAFGSYTFNDGNMEKQVNDPEKKE